MATGGWSIPELIAALTRGVLGVKLGPGVLGIIVPINIVGLISLAILVFSLSAHPVEAIIGLVFGICFLIYANERAFRYAEKNPIPALLSGTEFSQLIRDQMSAKDKSIVVSDTPPVEGSSTKMLEHGGKE